MKKILFFGLFVLVIAALNAHASCLLENIQRKQSCTGAASPVEDAAPEKADIIDNKSNVEHLKQMYAIPSISAPTYYKNGFPILNPSTNCMYGNCLP